MPVIHVRVQPRSSRNGVVRREGDVWWIRLTAPPVEGKANAALLEYLGEVLGVAKSRLSIEKGHTGRQKSVAVEGLDEGQVQKLLQGELG
ncbi:MAG: DUF167 domain-containing protein [Dehalococcoidia bacterium]|nr:DUF167 domain-containing protein [Dehalococcoidia bacterium]